MIRERLCDKLHWVGGAGATWCPAITASVCAYTSSISAVAPKLSIKLHELGVAQASNELNQLITEHVVPLYALRTKRKDTRSPR